MTLTAAEPLRLPDTRSHGDQRVGWVPTGAGPCVLARVSRRKSRTDKRTGEVRLGRTPDRLMYLVRRVERMTAGWLFVVQKVVESDGPDGPVLKLEEKRSVIVGLHYTECCCPGHSYEATRKADARDLTVSESAGCVHADLCRLLTSVKAFTPETP